MAAPESDSLAVWEQRIAGEFGQCPGLRRSAAQAARLWGVELRRIESVFAALVRRQLLVHMANGVFVRRGTCPKCE